MSVDGGVRVRGIGTKARRVDIAVLNKEIVEGQGCRGAVVPDLEDMIARIQLVYHEQLMHLRCLAWRYPWYCEIDPFIIIKGVCPT